MPISTPDNPAAGTSGTFVWAHGTAQGAATFARLEGCWYGNDATIYIVSTSGGIGQGQIWVYSPAEETLTWLFQSPGAAVLNAPDNICVSPRGGLVLCEDGNGEEFLHGLTVDGEIFPFARNTVMRNGERNGIVGNVTGSEWAGACFSPDGRWLFANLQSPRITFATLARGRQEPCKTGNGCSADGADANSHAHHASIPQESHGIESATPTGYSGAWCRTSRADTMKMTSSAMFVA